MQFNQRANRISASIVASEMRSVRAFVAMVVATAAMTRAAPVGRIWQKGLLLLRHALW
jgi:hypothetical protein